MDALHRLVFAAARHFLLHFFAGFSRLATSTTPFKFGFQATLVLSSASIEAAY
jgi:hypothetical protein